jgi:hypothetical protein
MRQKLPRTDFRLSSRIGMRLHFQMLNAPDVWPMPFDDFLSKVVGKVVKSARTEKRRIERLTEFLIWYREILRDPRNQQSSTWVRSHYFLKLAETDWTPEEIILEKIQDGIEKRDAPAWESLLTDWLLKSRKQVTTKLLIYPIKFKVCLRLSIGGRLHKDRLQTFREYWCDALKDQATIAAHYNQPYEHPTHEARLSHANLMIEKFNQEGIDEMRFNELKTSIKAWRVKRMRRQRKAARANRTLKFYRRKLVNLLKNHQVTLRRAENAVSLNKSAVSLAENGKKVRSRRTKSAIP